MLSFVKKGLIAIAQETRFALGLPKGRRVFLRSHVGNIDHCTETHLIGWAAYAKPDTQGEKHQVRVGLFVGEACLRVVRAGLPRPDVAAVGAAPLHSGFAFDLDLVTRRCIALSGKGGCIYVLPDRLSDKPVYLASANIDLTTDVVGSQCGQRTGGRRSDMTRLQATLSGNVLRLSLCAPSCAQNTAPHNFTSKRIGLDPKRKLLSRKSMIPPQTQGFNARTAPDGHTALPAYLEYVRHRWGLADQFNPQLNADDGLGFLLYYIKHFGAFRDGHRVPLSKQNISDLNADFDEHSNLSVAMAHLQKSDVLSLSREDRLFDWALNGVADLGVEDCLVRADHIVELARTMTNAPWAVTRFAQMFHDNLSGTGAQDLSQLEARQSLYAQILLFAVSRPDVLRYIPAYVVTQMLTRGTQAHAVFEMFLAGQHRKLATQYPELPPLTDLSDAYHNALDHSSFSLEMNRFTHVLDTGGRLDSTAFAPPLGSNVDVQIIGPLTKASGLGVAARLSHSALLKTPFSSHAVRFDMDNPTPEIPDSKHVSTQYRPAKVNLIHLNAELLPEFAAYAPDVMSDAYNIGFFFWEMDHPAACHFLGMGLLDEIWVASEYCKKTYEPFSEVPVINVGLAATPLPQVDHAAVRKTLRQDCGFSQDSFVFVTTLDSYSFVQRKNPTAVIAAFELAFAGKPDVKLVIKSQNRKKVKDAAQDLVWAQMEQACLRNPNIVLVDDTLSYQGVIAYIAGADCYVSLHRAEGWGFGMIEAMQLSVPVICTGYSGNLDFCTEETSYLVDFDMISVNKDDYLYVEKGQTWADPNIDHAAQHMQKVYSDPQSVTQKIAAAHKILDEKFNVGSLADRFEERLKSQI